MGNILFVVIPAVAATISGAICCCCRCRSKSSQYSPNPNLACNGDDWPKKGTKVGQTLPLAEIKGRNPRLSYSNDVHFAPGGAGPGISRSSNFGGSSNSGWGSDFGTSIGQGSDFGGSTSTGWSNADLYA